MPGPDLSPIAEQQQQKEEEERRGKAGWGLPEKGEEEKRGKSWRRAASSRLLPSLPAAGERGRAAGPGEAALLARQPRNSRPGRGCVPHLPQAIFKTASCLILIPSPLLRLEHWPRAAPQHAQPGCARLYGDVYMCLYVYKSLFFPRMAVGALRGASGRSWPRRVPAAPPGAGPPPGAPLTEQFYLQSPLTVFIAPVSSALLYFTRAWVHQSLWQLYTLRVNGETRGNISFSKAIESSVTVLIFVTVFFLFALLVISSTGGNERADPVFVLFSHPLYLRVAKSRMF